MVPGTKSITICVFGKQNPIFSTLSHLNVLSYTSHLKHGCDLKANTDILDSCSFHELAPPMADFNSELFSICDNIQNVGVIMEPWFS